MQRRFRLDTCEMKRQFIPEIKIATVGGSVWNTLKGKLRTQTLSNLNGNLSEGISHWLTTSVHSMERVGLAYSS